MPKFLINTSEGMCCGSHVDVVIETNFYLLVLVKGAFKLDAHGIPYAINYAKGQKCKMHKFSLDISHPC